jgi:hypothetical protein
MRHGTLVGHYLIFVMVLAVVIAWKSCDHVQEPQKVVHSDTIIRIDTIHDTVPKLVSQEVVRYIKEKPVSLTDSAQLEGNPETLYMADSGEVVVPITQKTYTDSSTYRAVISGYRASLDSIDIYKRDTVINTTITITEVKQKRWNFGIQGGFGRGITTGKFDIYIGIGGTFTFPP